jgi:iron complex transport system substrate-binding protein
LNPDVIVDLAPPFMIEKLGRGGILKDWNELGQVNAVKNHRVLIFDQDYAYIPGPRFLRFVEELARRLHPEVVWSDKD